VDIDRTAERRGDHRCGLRAPRVLAGPVCDVDQRGTVRGQVLSRRVMPQVSGDEGINAGAGGGTEQRVPGTAADRDSTDRSLRITGSPHTPRGLGQRVHHPAGERLQRFGLGQLADSPEPGVRGPLTKGQHAGDPQSQRVSQRIGHSWVGCIGVGVRAEQPDPSAHQPVHQGAFGIVSGHAVHPAQQQRMVGDEQLHVLLQRLGDGLGDRIDGHQHPLHRLGRVPTDQPHRIPTLSERRRVRSLQHSNHVAHCRGHPRTAIRLRMAPWRCLRTTIRLRMTSAVMTHPARDEGR
jgi:hypothetical protein